MESHDHWAVGHVDGFSIRVHRDGEVTDAFKVYHDLAGRLADYPILDEEDYSRREYEATLENIADAAWRLRGEYDLPDGWEGDVFSWFWNHNQRAVEDRDDQGGYPDEDDLRAAFEALGYGRIDRRVGVAPNGEISDEKTTEARHQAYTEWRRASHAFYERVNSGRPIDRLFDAFN